MHDTAKHTERIRPPRQRTSPGQRVFFIALVGAWIALGIARPSAVPQPLGSPSVPARTSAFPDADNTAEAVSLTRDRQATYHRAIATHALPAHLLILRELNTIPGSTANELTIRSIGALAANSDEADDLLPDAMLAVVENSPGHFNIITYGFAMDRDSPRVTMVLGAASSWRVVPESIDIARSWGALALVDVDAILPFLFMDSIGPGQLPEALAARARARGASIREALDCSLPRSSPDGCVPPESLANAIVRGDAAALDLLDSHLAHLDLSALHFAAGCLMRFDPDPTGMPVCLPSQMVAIAAEPDRRDQLSDILLRIALDEASDGPNRMRAADGLRHLIRAYPQLDLDTDGLHPFIATFIANERARARPSQAPEEEPGSDPEAEPDSEAEMQH